MAVGGGAPRILVHCSWCPEQINKQEPPKALWEPSVGVSGGSFYSCLLTFFFNWRSDQIDSSYFQREHEVCSVWV